MQGTRAWTGRAPSTIRASDSFDASDSAANIVSVDPVDERHFFDSFDGWPAEPPTESIAVTSDPVTQQIPLVPAEPTETSVPASTASGPPTEQMRFTIPEPSPDDDLPPRHWIRTLLVFGIAAVVYGVSAWRLGHTKTPTMAYWDQLADSFRHGRLFLAHPSGTQDLTRHDGRWYVPFGPLPGLLLVPWALIAAVVTINTVAFSVLLGAINVALVDALLHTMRRRGVALLSDTSIVALTLLWAVGSVHWYMSVAGTVWFISQIATATFMLLSLWSAAAGRRLLAGVALGLAALGRPTALLALPAVVALAAVANPHPAGRRRWPQALSMITVPAALVAAGWLWYNRARFGSSTAFGYTTQNVARELASDLLTHGQFNARYLPRNLWAMLAAGPVKDPSSWTLKPDAQGMSMLLTTPAWVFALFADLRQRLTRWSWLAVVLLIVPIAFSYNTGSDQFGYRFALDFMPVLMVLLALGLDRYQNHFGRVLPKVLIAIGIAVNLWGLVWFT